MTTVSSTTSTASTTSSSSSSGTLALGTSDFLQLLMTQLENQNPLDPTDTTEFTSQLATYSSLEQQINMNDTLTSLSDTMSSLTDTTSTMSNNISSLLTQVQLLASQSE